MLEVLFPATTSDLTVRDTVKEELKITGTAQDLLIDRLIGEVSSKICAYCNRVTFGKEDLRQTEYLSKDLEAIVLDRNLAPVVTQVLLNDAVLDPSEYFLDGSLLRRPFSNWVKGDKVVILYTAGYTLLGELPQALERACLDAIRHLYFSREKGDPALRSERVLDIVEQSYAVSSPGATASGLPASVEDSLTPFVDWIIA